MDPADNATESLNSGKFGAMGTVGISQIHFHFLIWKILLEHLLNLGSTSFSSGCCCLCIFLDVGEIMCNLQV